VPAFTSEAAHRNMYIRRYGMTEGLRRHSAIHSGKSASQAKAISGNEEPGQVDEVGPAPEGGGEGGNFLTRHYGPLPGWGWAVSIGAAVILFIIIRKNKSTSSSNLSSQTNASGLFGSPGTPAYQANVGGYDSATADSVLGQIQQSLATTQQGVNQLPTSSQIGQLISTTPAPVAVPNPNNAPIQAPDAATAYITGQYENILNRMPDAAGQTYWLQKYYTLGPQGEAQLFNQAAQNELSQRKK
jgi:Domain of unknown function (DUF4214)